MKESIKCPAILYHYASMEKAYSIMSNKNIRLSDITKSNDINEMSIFVPDLFDKMLSLHNDIKGFQNEFTYKNCKDRPAWELIVSELKERIEKEFKDGSIATFALCLSEKGDLLSQWRGYANDGKGLSLGLDVKELQEFIGSSNGFYDLVKVVYLSEMELEEWIKNTAKELLWLTDTIMKAVKDGDVHYKTMDAWYEGIYGTLYYNILDYIEESIKFKSEGFSEEVEWRLYIKNTLNKEELKKASIKLFEERRIEFLEYIKNKIEFNATSNDLVPFISLGFDEFNNNILRKVKSGPNNKCRSKDMDVLLRKFNYTNCSVSNSSITYITR